MNYIRIYNLLIERAVIRQLGKSKKILRKDIGYIEKHHVIPVCLGGTDDKDNLVFLTAKEHFLAHLLLAKAYPQEDSLVVACQAMTMIGGNTQRVSGRLFEKIRKRYADIVSERMSGKSKSKEHKKNLSDSLKGRMAPHQRGHNNVSKRPEVAKKISESNKGKSKGPCSEEKKEKISKANKGHRGLVGNENPTNWRVSCIFCRKETALPALTRWHKDCKLIHI
jgi:hypothetical protein